MTLFKRLADEVLGEGWEEQLREQMFPIPPEQHPVRPPAPRGEPEDREPSPDDRERPAGPGRRPTTSFEDEVAARGVRERPERPERMPRPAIGDEIAGRTIRERPGVPTRVSSSPLTSGRPLSKSGKSARSILLGSKGVLRREFVIKELLEKPVALRSRDGDDRGL